MTGAPRRWAFGIFVAIACGAAALLLLWSPDHATLRSEPPRREAASRQERAVGRSNRGAELGIPQRQVVDAEAPAVEPQSARALRGRLLDAALRPVVGCGYALAGGEEGGPSAFTGADGSWALSVSDVAGLATAPVVEFFVAGHLRALCHPKVNPCSVVLPPFAEVDVSVLGVPASAAGTYGVQPTEASADVTASPRGIVGESRHHVPSDVCDLTMIVEVISEVVRDHRHQVSVKVLAGEFYSAFVTVPGYEIAKPLRIDRAPFVHQVMVGARAEGLHVEVLDEAGEIAAAEGLVFVSQGESATFGRITSGRGVCRLPSEGAVDVAFRSVDGHMILGFMDEAAIERDEVCLLSARDAIEPTRIDVPKCQALMVEKSDGGWIECRRLPLLALGLGATLREVEGKTIASIPDARWTRAYAIADSGAVVELVRDAAGSLGFRDLPNATRSLAITEVWPEVEPGDQVDWILECQIRVADFDGSWVPLRTGEAGVTEGPGIRIDVQVAAGFAKYRLRGSRLHKGVHHSCENRLIF